MSELERLTAQAGRIKATYPVGTRIRLIKMSDPHPVPSGSCGTVEFVDDIGQLQVKWDNGSRLAIVPEVDQFSVIDEDCEE